MTDGKQDQRKSAFPPPAGSLTDQERSQFGETWPAAVEYVNKQVVISATELQRQLHISWVKAQGILSAMERQGMVGQFHPGTCGREVFANTEARDAAKPTQKASENL